MKKKKYTAAAVAAACVMIYYIGIAVLFAFAPDIPRILRIILIAIPLAYCAVLAFVLRQRIREIKSGEEDDLEKY